MNDRSKKNLSDLPPTNDKEFWEEAQTFTSTSTPVKICHYHKGKDWIKGQGYIDNHNGTIICKWCSWGTTAAGYLKVHDGRIIDLRSITRK